MGLRAPQAPQTPQPAQVAKPALPEFQAQRKKVEQRINADTQGQQDAMARRFAAQGMLNSGAAIKNQGLVANQATQNREDALAQVDAAEMGEQNRRQEVVDARDFAANESRLGRDFQAGESRLGRDFQGSESALARALQGSQFDRSFNQAGQQFKDTFGLQQREFDAGRQDQQRNIAASTANLKGDDRKRYNAYLASQGLPPLPEINQKSAQAAQQSTNPFERRAAQNGG